MNIRTVERWVGPRGETRAYTMWRLKRERPDLHALVEAGTLSVNQAAIAAGMRKKRMGNPVYEVRRWFKKLTPEEQDEFRREIGA